MNANRFDETLEKVSTAHGLNWSDESKIMLFATFCQEQGVDFTAWEDFLEQQAEEEASKEEWEKSLEQQAEEEEPCSHQAAVGNDEDGWYCPYCERSIGLGESSE